MSIHVNFRLSRDILRQTEETYSHKQWVRGGEVVRVASVSLECYYMWSLCGQWKGEGQRGGGCMPTMCRFPTLTPALIIHCRCGIWIRSSDTNSQLCSFTRGPKN
ncbi:hypothetical protein J6590_012499 [Homalodisca vitripennis]|nr:hypothetical protein J6590_012499 [Homalodisca vitripennis]